MRKHFSDEYKNWVMLLVVDITVSTLSVAALLAGIIAILLMVSG